MSDGPVMLSPTEQRLMDLLSDGLPHTKKEMVPCLADPLGGETNVKTHLHNLRKKLLPRNEAVLCVIVGGRIKYQFSPAKYCPQSILRRETNEQRGS